MSKKKCENCSHKGLFTGFNQWICNKFKRRVAPDFKCRYFKTNSKGIKGHK